MIKSGDKIILDIEGISSEGYGIGRVDGFVVFVPRALPGDKLEVLLGRTKKRYGYAEILGIVQDSPFRLPPPCPYANLCGGCAWQICEYSAQLGFKKQIVTDVLQRIGGIKNPPVADVIGMDNPWFYRNKGVFPVQDGKIGMYGANSHNLVEIEKCDLQHKSHSQVIQALRNYFKANGIAISSRLMVRSGSNNEMMVALDDIPINAYGIQSPSFIHQKLGHITYRLSAPSFFQVNTEQAKVLYNIAVNQAALDGSQTVFDAHAGVGGTALYAAARARHIIGVDIVEAAILDARENASINNITNAEFVCGFAEKAIPVLLKQGKRPDVIFLDPPRKGNDTALLDAIIAAEIPLIVYISCDMATLARDIKQLVAGGYALVEVMPVDMFAQTPKIEVSCLLVRE